MNLTFSVVEGEPAKLVLSSTDGDGAQHRVQLTIAHDNGPNLGVDALTGRPGLSDEVAAHRLDTAAAPHVAAKLFG